MAINIAEESLLTLSEAARSLPLVSGRHPHVCSVWRWCRKGLKGVRLEYVRVGQKICTSQEALNRFVCELAAADEISVNTGVRAIRQRTVGKSAREKQVRDAYRSLESNGA